MSKISFKATHKDALDKLLLKHPGVTPGKMFGYPAYYFGKKLVACVYGDDVAVRLPEAKVDALQKKSPTTFKPFEPMAGRVMREWVRICRANSSELARDKAVFAAATQFVAAQKMTK